MNDSIRKLLIPIFVLALFGCHQTTGIIDPPNLIRGKVILINFEAGDTLRNASGVLVSIPGTAFTATTNEDGVWTMMDVPAGIYDYYFSRPGFDSLLLTESNGLPDHAVQYSGEGTLFLPTIALRSSSVLSDNSITLDPVKIVMGINPVQHIAYYRDSLGNWQWKYHLSPEMILTGTYIQTLGQVNIVFVTPPFVLQNGVLERPDTLTFASGKYRAVFKDLDTLCISRNINYGPQKDTGKWQTGSIQAGLKLGPGSYGNPPSQIRSFVDP